jgi:hypothetical protein
MRTSALFLLVSILLPLAARADTVIFKNGEELEGKILERDEASLLLEVDCGTMVIPMDRVLRVEIATPEQLAAAKKKIADMKAEGKSLYGGKWLTKDEIEEAQAANEEKKQKRDEARLAAKKKSDEDAKQKKATADAQRKKAQDEAAKQQTAASSLKDRYTRRHDQNGQNNNQYNNQYNNQTNNPYNRNNSYYNQGRNPVVQNQFYNQQYNQGGN